MASEAKPVLLIVDDDPGNRETYCDSFLRQPYTVKSAPGGREALEILEREQVDVLLTDMKMPDVDGLEVVKRAASLPVPPVSIVITAFGSIQTAVEAMRLGAFHYLTKPVNILELRGKVEQAMKVRAMRLEQSPAPVPAQGEFFYEGKRGTSRAMEQVLEQVRQVAPTRASVLIEGESGTGKELIAHALHFNSPRREKPFVPIHCAAITESLLESELFGHEKGSFTGAEHRRRGKFESAEGGTVFLDEIGEISLATQVKLLRVLEQREIVRVGSSIPTPIDIRLLAATNKNLKEEVDAGRFREDLFYRLNVVRIVLPPLRDRPEDIPPLVQHFLQVLSRENQRGPFQITPEAMNALTRHPWYGNVRELRNIVEQVVVFARKKEIGLEELPASLELLEQKEGRKGFLDPQWESAGDSNEPNVPQPGDAVSLATLEEEHIKRTLDRMGWNRTDAAKELGISRRTLQRKLKELELDQH